MPASFAPHVKVPPSGPATHAFPASEPELEPELLLVLPELLPLPELDDDASVPPELDPLEPLLSIPASSPPLLELVLEEFEHAFVPMVPMPPITNRHAQKASFFMSSPDLPV